MTNFTEALGELIKFTGALYILSGAMAWWKKGSGAEEDALHIEAANTVLDAVVDADKVSKIELANGRNIRDQLTIEQAIEMDEERRLRSWPNRN